MPSADKATVKAGALGELVDALDASMQSAIANRAAVRASADAVKRLLERFHSYRPRIDDALDDGTFPADSREAVFAVFTDLVRMTDSLRAQLDKAASDQAPFLAGMSKAKEVALGMREREERAAMRSRNDEDEEEEYRREREQRRASADTPPSDALTGQRRRASDEPDPAPPRPRAKRSRPPTALDSATSDAQACAHCSQAITMHTGSEWCSACVSHRNRYGSLPSDRVLAKRRARSADAHA